MKMFLSKDHIRVELHGDSLPSDVLMLEPFHWNRSRTIYYFSIRKLPEVLKVFNKPVDTLPPAVKAAYDKVMWQRYKMEGLLRFGPSGDPVVNERLTLRRHQQIAREVAQIYDRFAFYYDTRTGKTPLSIAIMYDDIKAHPDHKWLVVAPRILLELAWEEDIKKFIPNIPTVVCYDKLKKKRIEKIKTPANIYIINTESFVNYLEYFEGVTRIIIDESSSMKSTRSKFSKAVVDFSRACDRIYLLSGTPAPNGAQEYYEQIRALDYYGIQQSYAQFKQKYFINTARDVRFEKLILRPDMKDELQDLIHQYALYVDKEDVLTTPGINIIERIFKMPPEIADAYKRMAKDLYASVSEDVDVLAPSAAAKLNKLNQITSGFLIDTGAVHENSLDKGDRKTLYLLSDYRFQLLNDLLKEIGNEQAIVWANYRFEFEFIEQMLGAKCRTVYGGTEAQAKIDNVRDFKDGKVQYLVANPASADKGLTLTNCHICIYFCMNWSYELFKQSMDRIYGDISIQPHVCQYYIMMAKGTVDEKIYRDVLLGKKEASYAILDHLKAVNDGDFI